jgi:hypothetical protein
MRWAWIAAAVALFLVLAAIMGWLPLGAGPRCLVDDAIEPAVRAKAQSFSKAFFEAVLRRDGETAYAMLTPDYRKQTSADDFDAALSALVEGGGGGFTKLSPEAAYEVSRGAQPGRVFCGNSETGVTVNARPGDPQIHTLYSAETPAHKWALNAWLVPTGDTWAVASFYVSIASVGAYDAEDLQKLADVQAGRGHAFNAYMLMSAASATAYRGPDFQPVAKPRIDAALAAMKVPAELAGNPPRTWKMGGATYAVEQVTIVGAPDKALGLVIQYRDASWDLTDPDGEVRNRALIDAFVKKHPAWSESFGFLVARILRPGENMGWGTVFDAKAGFAEAAAPQ